MVAKMLTKMLAILCRIPEICASVVVAEECTLQQACCPCGVEEQMQEDERVVDIVIRAGQFGPTGLMANPRGLTKVRRQAFEDVASMFARTASACQRCNCGLRLARVPRQPLAALVESNSPWAAKERKNANQRTNGVQLLNTTWFTPSGRKMSQFKKKTSHMFGTHKNVPARANPVCAVHRPCLLKDRKRAGMSRSGTSRPTQHGWSSLAASGASQLGGKKSRLSVTQAWLFWWNVGARIVCQKRIMSIQMFRRPFKSALSFTILPMPRLRALGSGRSASIP